MSTKLVSYFTYLLKQTRKKAGTFLKFNLDTVILREEGVMKG